MLPRFSTLAGVCVFVTALTGSALGLAQLTLTAQQPWYLALTSGGYGYILLGKAVAVLILGALGAHVRFRLLPAIRARARTALLRWVGWELAVMGTAFGLAVVLTRTPFAAG